MNYIEKATNYYLKLLRSGSEVKLSTSQDNYWITDGYVAHAFPKSEMEINPDIIKSAGVDFKFLCKISGEMIEVKNSQIVRRDINRDVIPLVSDANKLTIWIDKKYIDLFPKHATFFAKNHELSTVLVYVENEPTGIICPVRRPTEDISLFI